MSAQPMSRQGLIDCLPTVRGRLTAEAALAPLTWFPVGGPAEVLFEPADEADLADFLRQRPADLPVLAIGAASNLLVRDGGIAGVVVRLGAAFASIAVDGAELIAGAATVDVKIATAARDAGIAGLEFLRGIPGTLGGAFRSNAGAFGGELKDVLVEAVALDGHGRRHVARPADLALGYRHAAVPADWIFLSARLKGRFGDRQAIGRRMVEIADAREAAQPVKARSGGSTFRNPPGHKAWELIDAAGCRGLMRGQAMVSEQHCNFLVNLGRATAADLEALGEEVRRRVFAQCAINLEWEVVRVGEFARPPAKEWQG